MTPVVIPGNKQGRSHHQREFPDIQQDASKRDGNDRGGVVHAAEVAGRSVPTSRGYINDSRPVLDRIIQDYPAHASRGGSRGRTSARVLRQMIDEMGGSGVVTGAGRLFSTVV